MDFLRIEKINAITNINEISVTENFYNIKNIVKMKVDRNIEAEDGNLKSCVAVIYFDQTKNGGKYIDPVEISDIETIEEIISQLY